MPKQVRRAAANQMFSRDDIIFSYTTKQAVADGVLIKAEPEQSSQAAIRFPVYFTSTVWNRYVLIPPEFKGMQNFNIRLGNILMMFAFQAQKCSEAVLKFQFNCQIPKDWEYLTNEVKSGIPFQYRDVKLKAVISAQDIDDPSPAIFIMLPWED